MEVRQAFDVARSISTGWEALRRQPVGLLVGSLLLTLTGGGGGSGGGGGGGGGDLGGGGGQLGGGGDTGGIGAMFDQLGDLGEGAAAAGAVVALGLLGCLGCLALCVLVFRAWVHAGYLRQHMELFRDGASPLGTLFSGGDAVLRMIGWKLLRSLVFVGTFVAAYAPMLLVIVVLMLLTGGLGAGAAAIREPESPDILLPTALVGMGLGGLAGLLVLLAYSLLVAIPLVVYVGLGLAFGAHAVALDDAGPVEALGRSWSLARGARFHLLVYFVALGLFRALGLLACCLGVVATRAVADAGVTEGYLRATRAGWTSAIGPDALAPLPAAGPPAASPPFPDDDADLDDEA